MVPGSGVRFSGTLPGEVVFARWLQQPPWTNVAGDEITWGGTRPTDTAITFSLAVSYMGGSSDVVVKQAVYTHTTRCSSFHAIDALVRTEDLSQTGPRFTVCQACRVSRR